MTTFNGALDITVHDAQLTLPQHLSKQDPYCVITLGSSGLKNLMEGERFGKEKFQTKVHNNAGNHPVWNESHSLSLKNMTFESHLKVKIYDKDVVKDDYLGVAKVNLDELMRFDGKGVQYYPIFKKGTFGQPKAETIGQVGVAIKFNCTEIPSGRADLKTQASEAMTRKDQAPMGVHGIDQQGHASHLGGPQQSVPSTYQGPVQSIQPTGSTTGAGEIQTHHKPGLMGTALGATAGALGATALAHGTHGTHGTQGITTHPTTMGHTGMTGTGMGTTGYTGGMTPVTTFNGSIDITISDAKINITQHGSKSDPYCVVALGSGGLKTMMEGQSLMKEKFQTKVHNNAGQNPIWNETHALSLKNMKFDSTLEVRLYDKDVIKDDYLGIASITLGELLAFDKRGVQYIPLWKKGSLRQTTSEQIGQVGLGVVFNCTEIPQAQADFKSQATDSMFRKEQQASGVSGPYQTAQTTGAYHHQTAQPGFAHQTQQGVMGSTVNQPLDTKPVYTQGTIPQTQGQMYGH